MGDSIKISYDSQVDAAYFAIKQSGPGEVVKTYTCDIEEVGGIINLDFDKGGRLVGIEILDATALLPPNFIFSAS